MATDQPPRRTEELYTRELNRLRKAAEAGNELAPSAALFFCAQYQTPVPEWLTPLAARSICNYLNPNRPRKRGRSSGVIERCHQNMIDFVRWDEVRQTRYQQKQRQHDLELLRTDFKDEPPNIHREAEKMADWAGTDWLRAFECASMMLQGTPAFGGPDAVKASYCRVEASHKDPVEVWRYLIFQPEFLESIGLQHPSRWMQSSKWVPLYELTL